MTKMITALQNGGDTVVKPIGQRTAINKNKKTADSSNLQERRMHNEIFCKLIDDCNTLPSVSCIDVCQFAEHDIKWEPKCVNI